MSRPRLIFLNGAPASGKSTLARRYAEAHPMSLNFDIDMIRSLFGRWRDAPTAAGMAARAITLSATRTHLGSGHDVIIPQLLARPEFIDDLAALAAAAEVTFHEIMLVADRDDLISRHARRAPTVSETHSPISAADLSAYDDQLMAMARRRPHCRMIDSRPYDVDGAYREFVACLGRDADGLAE